MQGIIKTSKKIRFEGNGYGQAWVDEAAKRGLSNHKDTPRAIEIWKDKETIKLFNDLGILTPVEIEAKHEIELENYILKIQIESRVMGDLAKNHIIPAAIAYQNSLIENVSGLMEVLGEKEGKQMAKTQIETIRAISNHMNIISETVEAMIDARKKANKLTSASEKAYAYCDKVKVMFETIRYHADKLEITVDDEIWPLPKFREMLFAK